MLSCDSPIRYAVFTDRDVDIYTVDSLKISQSRTGNTFSYSIGKHKYEYQLDFDDLSNAKHKYDGSFIPFVLDDSSKVNLNGEVIKIYKFLTITDSIDRSSIHYITKEYGLILIKSTVWSTQIELYPWAQSIIVFSGLHKQKKSPEIDEKELLQELDSLINIEFKDGS